MTCVLVVDDDSPMLRVVGADLRSRAFAVVTASDAGTALDLAARRRPDAVLLDLGLPDLDGLDLLRSLRAWTSVPVLVVSGRTGVATRVAALDAGADDYVQKPFAFPELIARVRALLRRGGAAVPPVLRVGDLELDAGRFRATRGDVPIPLTPKEFAILEYFMRHAGQLVTRTMLLDQCWDASYEGVSNLVDVHVGRVRRKLDAAGGAALLHTIRGAGFVLDEQPR